MTGTLLELAPQDPRIAAVATMLRGRGVSPGDAVAWKLPNGGPAMSLLWACWSIGAVAVPLHHRATDIETAAMLGRLDVSLVVDPDEVVAALTAATSTAGTNTAPTFEPAAVAPGDLALILHTSGSSGTPKAVRHLHGALTYKARIMAETHGLDAEDCVLMPAPLAHISGILNGVLVPAAARMRTVLMNRWDPERAIELIQANNVTFMVGPPTFFSSMQEAKKFRRNKVRSLGLISAGGAGVTREFCEDASWLFKAVVKRSYGSTEAPTMTTSHFGDPGLRGWTTDGRAVGSVELRLTDAGELEVRGPELFAGYVDPAQTEAAMTADGWFRTGDLATIDEGWLTVTGRLSDTIIRGGENISAGEVEAILETHPWVTSAVAVARPDEHLGEQVCAFVVCAPDRTFDLEECRRLFTVRGVATFKTPEHVVMLDELPMLASGKVDRAELRRHAATVSGA